MAGTRTLTPEPPRSTAYYYADLERLKRKPENELNEYISNEVVDDIPAREIPPFRDRQWSLPEYNTPENKYNTPENKALETYSTAGTFPMPKEKEPLLAELEVVGRMPLTHLDSTTSSVRRSRSWYLCCPHAEEEIREPEWRYSSLRPVTVPPAPREHPLSLVATLSSRTDEVSSLRAERDALARALAGERARAASAARAHDARLAELHGVIAELVRRARGQPGAIPEEDCSDECESTTQPAGELDNDADRSRTEQNESSSLLSPELPTPQEKVDPEGSSDTSHEAHIRCDPQFPAEELSLHLSEKGSDACLDIRCDEARASSCEREHGSDQRVYTASPGRCEARQAKLASRVRLKRTEDNDSSRPASEQSWCVSSAERLARAADRTEAMVAQHNHGEAVSASLAASELRCARLQADGAVLRAALARAEHTAHRLYCACCVQESVCVGVCLALRAADRALEAYDVLLALAETDHARGSEERQAAELVASQLLSRLETHCPSVGSPLLSPGPWLHHAPTSESREWDAQCEARLRARAAALKADTVALRPRDGAALYSHHDLDDDEIPPASAGCSMAEMEAAVAMQEILAAKEAIAVAHAASLQSNKHTNKHTHTHTTHTSTQLDTDSDTCEKEHKSDTNRRRRRGKHWLETQAETDL